MTELPQVTLFNFAVWDTKLYCKGEAFRLMIFKTFNLFLTDLK